MKAVRLVESGKPLVLEEIAIPSIGEEDVLVRVRAAGICHSDVHYRAGRSSMGTMPITLGHEVAGVIENIGARVTQARIGERVCLHYNISCSQCHHCDAGTEQFCSTVKMLGHHVDGGYAEYIAVPAINAIPLPDEISFEAGATLMCASATAYHALHKGRVKHGDTVAVFGIGGLGMSAIQLARAAGATTVFAIDLSKTKLELAANYGAIPVNAGNSDVLQAINAHTNGRGVDVALELIGLPKTILQSIDCLGAMGRAVIVGLTRTPITVDTYQQVLANEAEIIGSNDHLLSELPALVELARNNILDTSQVVSQTIPLRADAINKRLDDLETFTSDVRAVIVP